MVYIQECQDSGWKLGGAKGKVVKVEYWIPYDKEQRKRITWDEFREMLDDKVTLPPLYFAVFNAKHIEGIPSLPNIEMNDINSHGIIKMLSANMEVEILNDGGDRAFYRPSEDKIHMPFPKYFESDYAYDAITLHELAHSTGAAHRLNRNLSNMFGSSDYAYEELIVEITSCFMSTNLRMKLDKQHIDNHKAYVQSWIQK